ncbi:MAG: hypothetical protein ACR2N5_04515 [Solirubrobacterales bacterium]
MTSSPSPMQPKAVPKEGRRRAAPAKPSAFGVAILSVAAFLAVLSLLAVRMSAGEDPALGAGNPLPSTAPSSTNMAMDAEQASPAPLVTESS